VLAGAVPALASALAFISGYTEELKPRSLLSSSEGFNICFAEDALTIHLFEKIDSP
jgi:hypothetical protein